MKKIYLLLLCLFILPVLFVVQLKAQSCAALTASSTPYESRCAATGSIKVHASGGSGSYKYKVTGPVNTNFTTSDSLTGLSAGAYNVVVNDIVTNCPYTYSIEAPSASGVGTSNHTGVFNGLSAGNYTIRLTDSCGGIQTRTIVVGDYTWWIDAYQFSQSSCTLATGFIRVVDSKGNISTAGGIPGFQYGVVLQPGDTIWSTSPYFSFNPAGNTSIQVIVKDNCGNIKKANSNLNFQPSVGNTVNANNTTCNSFTASLNNVNNFYNPSFCIYDNNNVLIECNSSGHFSNLPYGSYCIKAHDGCTDTTITRCFTVSAPPISVDAAVQISNTQCNSFTATITGQSGVTNATYCLYDVLDTLLGCNFTGVFSNLPYGHYCIEMTDGCRDTTIVRCFTATRPAPSLPNTISPLYITCTVFGLDVNGNNIYSPQYCLYDSNHVVIACNSTGIFDSIPLGNYCLSMYDSCYDTTITRCMQILQPSLNNNIVVQFTNKTCNSFTLHASGNNLTNPTFCLYTPTDSLIACNTTGVFNGLAYGNYCLKTHNVCPDTVFVNCFTAGPDLPSVDNAVTIIANSCSFYTAQITGQQNLPNPLYCLFKSNNVQVSCNSLGIFNALTPGTYCIKITTPCYDTVIMVCFTIATPVLQVNVSAIHSCSIGYAQLNVNIGSGITPYSLQLYGPTGNLMINHIYSSSSISIDSLAGLPVGQFYKIVVTDRCGRMDSATSGAVASYVNFTNTVINKCPSGIWANGSGDIKVTVSTNISSVKVRIIRKNFFTYNPSLVPNSSSNGRYTFTNLGPGTYIISCSFNNGCPNKGLDTVTIDPYQYPNLSKSTGYQCDVNGFSVGAVVQNGVSPFTYEIIGSTPSSPSVVRPPQSNPIFNINNGTNYSLIRLRVLDACGNASLQDASILPLAVNGITADFNCFQRGSILSVDTIYNSTYSWYKKDSMNSHDSTFMGSGYNVNIPQLMPTDTGIYICHIVVNSGCIKRTYYFHLNGSCANLLPVAALTISGTVVNQRTLIQWVAPDAVADTYYIIEKSYNGYSYQPIGRINRSDLPGLGRQLSFTDPALLYQKLYYRVKEWRSDGSCKTSNVLEMNSLTSNSGYQVYPNPTEGDLFVRLKGGNRGAVLMTISDLSGREVYQKHYFVQGDVPMEVDRKDIHGRGIFLLKCVDPVNNAIILSEKVFFR